MNIFMSTCHSKNISIIQRIQGDLVEGSPGLGEDVVSDESFSLSEMLASEGIVVEVSKGLVGGRALEISVMFSPSILMGDGKKEEINT